MPFRDKATGAYPVSHDQVRASNPNASFPAYFEEVEGYDWVHFTERPTFNPLTQYLEEGEPENTGGVWRQTWVVKDFSAEEVAMREAAKAAALMQSVVAATQKRLDDFARTRNYDGILSACTYATSTVQKFQAEGQYCVEARDATWASLYTLMDEVAAGTRPAPTGFADVEPLLPALEWPTV